jgi:ribonuclease R
MLSESLVSGERKKDQRNMEKNEKNIKDKNRKRKERSGHAGKAGQGAGRTKVHSVRSAADKKRQRLIYDFICSKNYKPMRAKEIAFLLEVPKMKRKEFLQALSVLEAKSMIEVDEKGFWQKYTGEAAGSFREAQQADDSAKDALSEGSDGGADSGRKRRGRRQNSGAQNSGRKRTVHSGEPGADITEIVLAYGVPNEFPDRVLIQADKCPDGPIDADYAGRTDFRDKLIITIDGDDSKDLDDAVSLEKSGSNYILGVHIADVSNYVQASSALDKEALKRGTSVYLPDRVIPMLPRKLSNGVCSLNEGKDRLTLSCIMKIDAKGQTIESKIVESVICSSHRMTYTEVEKIIVDKDAELMSQYADVVPMLFDMKKLAEILRDMRKKRGMIDFDFPETKMELDEEGHPVKIYARSANTATRLIEQFMLSANETVAKRYADLQLPFLYRTHENPDDEKIEAVLVAVRNLGVNVTKKGQHITPGEVQAIISEVEGNPKEKMISSMILRSMQQARYAPENRGHFGLAAQYYCHFTSPIRRYPDLQIHRIIKDDLRGRLGDRKLGYYERILDDVAWKSSALERRSVEVEREADKLKMAEYVENHLGEVTEAVVTGVTEWGVYVQRPDTIEGLVHISALKGDYYEYNEETMQLVGRQSGRIFEMGQTLTVRTVRADKYRRIIDFALVTENDEEQQA